MNIVLTGYRCTGKTSVGRLLAQMGGRPFLDTDELLCKHTGKTIAGIVAAEGWAAFREKERSVIEEVSRLDAVIIATGGGAVLDTENVKNLKKSGRIIWLAASADTIKKRLGGDRLSSENRPALTGAPLDEELRNTLIAREPLYRRCADMIVSTDVISEKEVAALIYRSVLSESSLYRHKKAGTDFTKKGERNYVWKHLWHAF
jgi:shikimate kinase